MRFNCLNLSLIFGDAESTVKFSEPWITQSSPVARNRLFAEPFFFFFLKTFWQEASTNNEPQTTNRQETGQDTYTSFTRTCWIRKRIRNVLSLCENEKRLGDRDRESCFWMFWALEWIRLSSSTLLGLISFVPGLYLSVLLFCEIQPRAIVAFERMRAGIGISTTTGCLESHCKTSDSHRYSRSPTHPHAALSLALFSAQSTGKWLAKRCAIVSVSVSVSASLCVSVPVHVWHSCAALADKIRPEKAE